MNRSGLTLVELVITMVVMAILGTALTRILIDDSRFVDRVDAMMAARQSARAAMNVMTVELQMVSSGGLVSAAVDSVTVRVPYAFGIACARWGQKTNASLMPADSAMYADATLSGLAWLDGTGAYNIITGVTLSPPHIEKRCIADSIRIHSAEFYVAVNDANALSVGDLFYLYESITYSFEPSTQLPGRVGLYRRDGSGFKEELLAPFDTSAGFAFLVNQDLTPSTTVPSDLSTVRGLQLKLVGASYFTAQGESEPEKFDLRTSVAFRNAGF